MSIFKCNLCIDFSSPPHAPHHPERNETLDKLLKSGDVPIKLTLTVQWVVCPRVLYLTLDYGVTSVLPLQLLSGVPRSF